MPETLIPREVRADGTLWDNMEGKRATPATEWQNTEIGLVNAQVALIQAVSKQFGLCGDGSYFPTANPGGAANVVEIAPGYCVMNPGIALIMDAASNVSVGTGDIGKGIYARRSYTDYNSKALPDGSGAQNTLRIHSPSVMVTSSPSADDLLLGTITNVDGGGVITISTAGRQYWTPNAGLAQISLDRLAPTGPMTSGMYMEIPSIPTNGYEEIVYLKSVLRYLFNGTAQGSYDSIGDAGIPTAPTTVTTVTGMESTLKYGGVSFFSPQKNQAAYLTVSWAAPTTPPLPTSYQVRLVPVTLVGVDDVLMTAQAIYYDAFNDQGSVSTSLHIGGLTPGVKYIPQVRAVRKVLQTYTYYSDWVSGAAVIVGSYVTVPNPGGKVLTVAGGLRFFDLSWDAIPDVSEYAVYGKMGGYPDPDDDNYLVFSEPVKGTACKVSWPWCNTAVYFKVRPLSISGVEATWTIDGSGTMYTDGDTPLTSVQAGIAGMLVNAPAAPVDLSEMAATGTIYGSVNTWLNDHGVDNMTDAMKDYQLVADAGRKVCSSFNITPSATPSTLKGDSWTADGNYTIKRVHVTLANQGATFTNSTVVTLYKNGVSLITISCVNGEAKAYWTDANENLVAEDEIYCKASSTGAAGAAVNFFVEVIKRYA